LPITPIQRGVMGNARQHRPQHGAVVVGDDHVGVAMQDGRVGRGHHLVG